MCSQQDLEVFFLTGQQAHHGVHLHALPERHLLPHQLFVWRQDPMPRRCLISCLCLIVLSRPCSFFLFFFIQTGSVTLDLFVHATRCTVPVFFNLCIFMDAYFLFGPTCESRSCWFVSISSTVTNPPADRDTKVQLVDKSQPRDNGVCERDPRGGHPQDLGVPPGDHPEDLEGPPGGPPEDLGVPPGGHSEDLEGQTNRTTGSRHRPFLEMLVRFPMN